MSGKRSSYIRSSRRDRCAGLPDSGGSRADATSMNRIRPSPLITSAPVVAESATPPPDYVTPPVVSFSAGIGCTFSPADREVMLPLPLAETTRETTRRLQVVGNTGNDNGDYASPPGLKKRDNTSSATMKKRDYSSSAGMKKRNYASSTSVKKETMRRLQFCRRDYSSSSRMKERDYASTPRFQKRVDVDYASSASMKKRDYVSSTRM